MNDYPRVHEILQATVLRDQDTSFLKPKYLRRGRLVEAAVTLLAQGQQIENSWWSRSSGDADDDRVDHEECLSYIEGGRKFLAEHDFVLDAAQKPVEHPVLRYVGHPDWVGRIRRHPRHWVIDLKNGPAPVQDSRLDYYERYQLADYVMALSYQMQISTASFFRANLHLYDYGYKLVERTQRTDFAEAKLLVEYYHLSQNWRTP